MVTPAPNAHIGLTGFIYPHPAMANIQTTRYAAARPCHLPPPCPCLCLSCLLSYALFCFTCFKLFSCLSLFFLVFFFFFLVFFFSLPLFFRLCFVGSEIGFHFIRNMDELTSARPCSFRFKNASGAPLTLNGVSLGWLGLQEAVTTAPVGVAQGKTAAAMPLGAKKPDGNGEHLLLCSGVLVLGQPLMQLCFFVLYAAKPAANKEAEPQRLRFIVM